MLDLKHPPVATLSLPMLVEFAGKTGPTSGRSSTLLRPRKTLPGESSLWRREKPLKRLGDPGEYADTGVKTAVSMRRRNTSALT
jgi:hypothetical protein